MADQKTCHIHITGQVQGVGFRPFIARLARAMHVLGKVYNAADGVHMFVNGDEAVVQNFIDKIQVNCPAEAKINQIRSEFVPLHPFSDFCIAPSVITHEKNTYISPDLGMCAHCREELHDIDNRRYLYPFITCTDCGPRWSVLEDIPYDRSNTSMLLFEMCPDCKKEYSDPANRRFHSQTNSCFQCGIDLSFYSADSKNSLITTEHQKAKKETYTIILNRAVDELKKGKIVAVKSNGGFLLLCDATNEKTVKDLRVRKSRPTKPFALLYPDISVLGKDVLLTDTEISALTSSVAPIVLCTKRKNISTGICSEIIAPQSTLLGVMLPYNPLLHLIARDFNGPLVATSANLSGSPILHSDLQVEELSPSVADFILTHNRPISQPQDDSVWRFSTFYHQKIILRRSRGMAPSFWNSTNLNHPNILATGADLKSSFALTTGSQIYISQFFGDLMNYDNQILYEKTLTKFLETIDFHPEIIVKDKHPAFQSSRLAQKIPTPHRIEVQHHQAHFAACLYEHVAWEQSSKAMGIIWDGVGYGDDGQVWGGEFFIYENFRIHRKEHFSYFPYLLGDKMSLQPKIAGLSILHSCDLPADAIKHLFSAQEWTLYHKMLHQFTGLYTSSMGRIFDAVASLLGYGEHQTYEGEAALMLEQLAMEYCITKEELIDLPTYPFSLEDQAISLQPLLFCMLNDIGNGVKKCRIAASFHKSLALLIGQIATKHQCNNLYFSGGVFQNGLLTDLIIHFLSADFNLHFHEAVSPNDENIALGQLACAVRGWNGK